MHLRRAARLLLYPTLAMSFMGARADVPTGRVVPEVACASDLAQTYALYVPTNFDRERSCPVLFCFDPGARGKTPVERFQAAAEKFGWIVAGSNNSRNGPWEANARAIQAMMGDVAKHLPIDRQRIYVAGLSGGARVACQLAVSGVAHGVVACSAGFMGSETPAKVPFPFFGTAGQTDFNYRELRRVDRELDERKAAHRIVIFDGGHEWLPADLAIEALGWLELHAMRAGTRPKNPTWIQDYFAARQTAVPREPLLENLRELRSIAADLKGLADTAALETRVRELSGSREVRDAQKAALASERAEASLSDRLMTAASENRASSERKTVSDLQARARSAPTAADRAMAQRVLQGVASGCGETARQAMRIEDYDTAAAMLEMAVLLRPERSQTHFELARTRALLGEKKRAIAALQQALAAGFKDLDRLNGETAFAKFRKDPEFVALLAKITP
jgi:predicted esterase